MEEMQRVRQWGKGTGFPCSSLYPNLYVFSSPEILQPFKVSMEASLSILLSGKLPVHLPQTRRACFQTGNKPAPLILSAVSSLGEAGVIKPQKVGAACRAVLASGGQGPPFLCHLDAWSWAQKVSRRPEGTSRTPDRRFLLQVLCSRDFHRAVLPS